MVSIETVALGICDHLQVRLREGGGGREGGRGEGGREGERDTDVLSYDYKYTHVHVLTGIEVLD